MLEFFTPETLEPDEAMLELMAQVGAQVGLMVEHNDDRQRLETLSRQHELLLSSAGDGICGLDAAGQTTFVNPAAAEMLGGEANSMIGLPLHDLVHATTADRDPGHNHSECSLHSALRDGITSSGEEEMFVRRDGALFPVAYTLTPMRERGALAGAVLTFRDVSERRRFERQLRHFADHDPLTDLFNRRRFEEELGQHTARVARRGGTGAVLLIDIDNFKYANDTLGHRAGDEILRKVAGLLRDRLRPTDFLARLGADEFAVLLTDAPESESVSVANELARMIHEQRFSFDGRSLQVTVSVGITPVAGTDLTPEELMVRADLAMYQAKDGGRDRISIYTPETAVVTRERIGLTWVERIRKALAEERFVLFGQPIYDVAANRVSQVELLLRMRDEDGELIAPGSFLPTAERFGLIQQIDSWVVREAINCLERISAGGSPLALEVNLSGLSIGDPELPRLIESELASASIDPATSSSRSRRRPRSPRWTKRASPSPSPDSAAGSRSTISARASARSSTSGTCLWTT